MAGDYLVSLDLHGHLIQDNKEVPFFKRIIIETPPAIPPFIYTKIDFIHDIYPFKWKTYTFVAGSLGFANFLLNLRNFSKGQIIFENIFSLYFFWKELFLNLPQPQVIYPKELLEFKLEIIG
jgi:hypothetical protein